MATKRATTTATPPAEPLEPSEPHNPEQVSVQLALARIISELPGIKKSETAGDMGYNYRGIEQVTREVQPLLARHGVVISPEVVSWEVEKIEVNRRPWSDTTLMVRYTVTGPKGDTIVSVVCGRGRDQSDKGFNKAMTQAFKYLLLQLLCIADRKDDGDAETHTADERQPPQERNPRVDAVLHSISLLAGERKDALRQWADGRSLAPGNLVRNADWLTMVEQWLEEEDAGLHTEVGTGQLPLEPGGEAADDMVSSNGTNDGHYESSYGD